MGCLCQERTGHDDKKKTRRKQEVDVRVLVDERGCVVNLVVNDEIEILLGGVSRHLGIGEILRHGDGRCVETSGRLGVRAQGGQ